jgi:hypothetical protein
MKRPFQQKGLQSLSVGKAGRKIVIYSDLSCGPVCFYSFANTKISPQKCTTFEDIFLCLLFSTWMRAGQVKMNWNLLPEKWY